MCLKYHCPNCGTALGYEGLCWKCKAEKERLDALAWTPEEVVEKQKNLERNMHGLGELRKLELTQFWNLLSYRDAITPQIQSAALQAKVFYPREIYYHASEDIRDGFIAALLDTKDAQEASCLMSCLAMQGDDKALEMLLELEKNPRPWRKKLYMDPSVYAQCGGWTFDKEGHRRQLNFHTCYPMVKGTSKAVSPVRIGRLREETCPHCGGQMVDMLVLDGRDERLKFLHIDGVLTATCCPNCVGFLKEGAFNHYTLEGGSQVMPSEIMEEVGEIENYLRKEDYLTLSNNTYVLAENPVPLFYGSCSDDIHTIGGFANWVQGWDYATCPKCGKPMQYLAQIQWAMLTDSMEGTLYIEFCPDCNIVSMRHQQT